MKLYDFAAASSAQRVRVFLAEKNINVPIVQLDVRSGHQFEEPFNTMNPFHCVPFLELEDGTVIAESISICRYLEEYNPEPSFFGRDARERAIIDMWNRRIELNGLVPALHALRNHIPMFEGRVIPGTRMELPQNSHMVKRGTEMVEVFMGYLEAQLRDNAFVAGKSVSISDITAWFAVNMAEKLSVNLSEKLPHVHSWYISFSERNSIKNL